MCHPAWVDDFFAVHSCWFGIQTSELGLDQMAPNRSRFTLSLRYVQYSVSVGATAKYGKRASLSFANV